MGQFQSPREYTEHERRQLLIARLPNVETLNGGGVISSQEREDAERAFIRYYMDKPEADRPERSSCFDHDLCLRFVYILASRFSISTTSLPPSLPLSPYTYRISPRFVVRMSFQRTCRLLRPVPVSISVPASIVSISSDTGELATHKVILVSRS